MTTQDILTRVNQAIAEIDANATCRFTLTNLRDDLETQFRHEIAKQGGTLNAARTVERILAAIGERRRSLAYPWIDAERRQCICDGFVAFRLRNHLPLPERPDDAGPTIELDKIFPASTDGMKALPMPSVKELRAFIGLEKAKYTGRQKNFAPLWDFGPHAPSVNAKYLLDVATVLPNAATLFWTTLVSPMYLSDETGEGVILPVRVAGKTMEPPANDAERMAIEAQDARNAARAEDAARRTETISKAHKDFEDAHAMMKAAMQQKADAEKTMAAAETDEQYAAAFDLWCTACEQEANARLRRYAAESVYNPTVSITEYEFEHLVHNLYIRDYANANVA